MDFIWDITPTKATPVVLALVYLVAIYWVRRPGRKAEAESQVT